MDAIYQDEFGRQPVSIVGVLYGGRVQIRFTWSGEVIVPVSMLEVDSVVASELVQWRALTRAWMTDDEYVVLEELSRAGGVGLLDGSHQYTLAGLDRKRVEAARRVLRGKGLVATADARPSGEGDGRQVRWRLTKEGCFEYVQARVLVRRIAAMGGRQLVTAVG